MSPLKTSHIYVQIFHHFFVDNAEILGKGDQKTIMTDLVALLLFVPNFSEELKRIIPLNPVEYMRISLKLNMAGFISCSMKLQKIDRPSYTTTAREI